MLRLKKLLCLAAVYAALPLLASTQTSVVAKPRPLLLAHYMPWFETNPSAGKWGWHWTMNHFDPSKVANGKAEIASHYHPIIGPYDNDDPSVIAYEVMLMKLSGIDGVLIDWYGNDDYLDYGGNQRRTIHLIQEIKKAGLKFGIVYEDQTVPRLISGKVFTKEQTETHLNAMLRWMDRTWFHDSNYVKLGGKPLLLVFGPQYLQDSQWSHLFAGVSPQPAFFTLMNPHGPAVGALGWPMPHDGDAGSAKSVDGFYQQSSKWSAFIPAAFPRFDDIYKEAGVSDSWGHIADNSHQLYQQLLTRGIQSGAPCVQLVTWNDWGEGTVLEPSEEFGYASLETTQVARKALIDPGFSNTVSDLRLVFRWYKLREQLPKNRKGLLDGFPELIYAGKVKQAKQLLGSAMRG